MKVKFKVPRLIAGHRYAIGIHEVPGDLKDHPYFMAQVQNGNLMIVEDKKVHKPAAPVMVPKVVVKAEEPAPKKKPVKKVSVELKQG